MYMKKSLIIVFASFAMMLQAQTTTPVATAAPVQDSVMKNTFGFAPISLATQTMSFFFEHEYKKGRSIKINPLIRYKEEMTYRSQIEVSSSYGLLLTNKYSIITEKNSDNMVMNLYFAPFAMYSYSHERDFRYDEYYITVLNPSYDPDSYYSTQYIQQSVPVYSRRDMYFNSLSGGMLVGVEFTVLKKLTIDLYLGGGLRRTKDNLSEVDYEYNSYKESPWEAGYDGVFARANIDIGIKF